MKHLKLIFACILFLFTAVSAFAAAQLKGDTAANWTSNNPTLVARQLGIETDTRRIKIGDGATAWTALPYMNPIPNVINGASSGSLTAAQVSSTMINNVGMGAADVALDLPAAAPGYSAFFGVVTAQANKWGVRAPATDTMTIIAADGTIGSPVTQGYARMTAAQAKQAFVCWSLVANAWNCKAASIGTSTFAGN